MPDLMITDGVATDSFVALSATPRGQMFKKHILSTGPLWHQKAPGGKIDIDTKFLDRMVENFDSGVCPIVQVPIVDEKNRHTEDPTRNIGQVVGLSREGEKLFAMVDVRKQEYVGEIGSTLIGASALMDPNARDTRTNALVGPTLYHVAITNRPHVTTLDEFSPVLAMSNVSADDVLMMSSTPDSEDPNMEYTLNGALDYLRAEHGIDVPDLQRKAETPAAKPEAVALSAEVNDKVTTALGGPIDLSASDTDINTVVGQLADKTIELSATIEADRTAAREAAATAKVDGLVETGRLLPTQRDGFYTLALSMDDEAFEALLPEKPLLELSAEHGTDHERTESELVEAERKRVAEAIAKSEGRA